MGALLIEQQAPHCPDLTTARKQLLQHLILSHHGKPEYGAARPPRCPEAVALHQADMLDSQLSASLEAVKPLEAGQWSEPVPGSGDRMFKI